ncbi:hypothetical protein PPTG_19649 [Phytophthora nicotianae INRA-310]|uniref:Uncharacterized protein n=1 Tax=Phytophthora nicotianae (strain INRA-310) TaxID=761204 RepID=W2PE05_PHYN3|nr:hypothetical protein PPTG_19649 [Phytophthora nicotianae INRA-310]ETM98249.1 hypothetical protein PPTG_19649 [Phytophthora nicotianae INRA-310]
MPNQRPEEMIRGFGEFPGEKSSEHRKQNPRQQQMFDKTSVDGGISSSPAVSLEGKSNEGSSS